MNLFGLHLPHIVFWLSLWLFCSTNCFCEWWRSYCEEFHPRAYRKTANGEEEYTGRVWLESRRQRAVVLVMGFLIAVFGGWVVELVMRWIGQVRLFRSNRY